MSFDETLFERTKFVPRTREVPVEGLKMFFGDEKPVWVVRSLNSNELNQALDAERRAQNVDTIIEALANDGNAADAVRKVLGYRKETPGEVRKRLEMLVLGSESPKIKMSTAIKLAETFAVEFRILTGAIIELTGLGYDVGKPAPASPKTPDLSQSCDLPNSEAVSSTNSDPTLSPTAG